MNGRFLDSGNRSICHDTYPASRQWGALPEADSLGRSSPSRDGKPTGELNAIG